MNQVQRKRRGLRPWMPTAPRLLVRCAAAMALALAGATAAVAQASAAPRAPEHHTASVRHQDAPGFPGTSTTAPFNECPAVGGDTSCSLLVDVTGSGTQFLQDTSQGPYDGADDTLVGIVNQSSSPIFGVTITSQVQPPIFQFDGDGICTYATGGLVGIGGGFTGDSYCSTAQLNGTDPGDYEGPINTFGNINSTQTTGTVVFPAPGLAPGASTYFSLENTPTAAQLSGGGTLSTPPGYDLAGSDGGVFVFPVGSSGFFGSLPGLGVHVNNVVGMVPTNNFTGYDLVGSDGGVFVFPVGLAAGFFGSLPLIHVTVSNVVGIVPTNNDTGYDLVGSDGGVFVFPTGQLQGFFGSLPGLGVHVHNIVGIVASPDGGGYFLVGSDGGVFPFGDAPFLGSLPGIGVTVNNIVGIASTPDGQGYWVVGADGSVYAFGDAASYGSLPALGVKVSNIVSIVPTPDAGGYWLIGTDGGVFAFGDATSLGSIPGLGVHVNNIVGAVPTL